MEIGKITGGAELAVHKSLEITGSIALYGMQISAALGETVLNRFGRPGKEGDVLDASPRFSYPSVLSETGLTRPSQQALKASQRLRDVLPPGD